MAGFDARVRVRFRCSTRIVKGFGATFQHEFLPSVLVSVLVSVFVFALTGCDPAKVTNKSGFTTTYNAECVSEAP